MSTAHDDAMQAIHSSADVGRAEDAVNKAREDDDPQTVFYLNPEPKFDGLNDLETTKYSWATKIEQTVQLQFGKKFPDKRHSIQMSWDRASYRAKLVDYLLRTTPWFILVKDEVEDPDNQPITGNYYTDKETYKRIALDYLQLNLPEVPNTRLELVAKYIAETLALGQDKLTGVQRFAVAFAFQSKDHPLVPPALRVVILGFERKEEGGKNVVEPSRTTYEAVMNSNLFHDQKFDEEMLNIGKPLVQEWTLPVTQ
ncbi:hypothetical protein BDV28DRAFT_127286 [Aspergillus coremiiformis]|uniref:Uncharacterized protein n=1 Tax=Aspergillus coremiiformis TaxID=138285 RepID=A0A5N6ZHL0_9EURO|nr:hypothetical protein BDV28DRAFT_127286 [Aspergillus coremiiformis]